jgi:hypothetical protein
MGRVASGSAQDYSRFCDLYRRWLKQLDLVLRQEHRAGEKLFVDYAGDTIPIQDARTGDILQASVFVAVLGASSYAFAEATCRRYEAHAPRASYSRRPSTAGASPEKRLFNASRDVNALLSLSLCCAGLRWLRGKLLDATSDCVDQRA